MYGINSDDQRPIDWGKTSADYAGHRPGPPQSYYSRLRALGIGSPNQRVLDLGTVPALHDTTRMRGQCL